MISIDILRVVCFYRDYHREGIWKCPFSVSLPVLVTIGHFLVLSENKALFLVPLVLPSLFLIWAHTDNANVLTTHCSNYRSRGSSHTEDGWNQYLKLS